MKKQAFAQLEKVHFLGFTQLQVSLLQILLLQIALLFIALQRSHCCRCCYGCWCPCFMYGENGEPALSCVRVRCEWLSSSQRLTDSDPWQSAVHKTEGTGCYINCCLWYLLAGFGCQCLAAGPNRT